MNAVHLVIRQVTETVVEQLVPRNLGFRESTPSPTAAQQESTMSSTSLSASTTISTAGPTTSAAGNGPSGSPNSPLLFFVALGFGVVFTNLWIIVGVKYCFRYNARNRARANGEEDENVDLQAMPRPRRRREKKLMTMDEVNERFPLIKYKAWRMAREQDGLNPNGGITAPPSRAASIRNVETQETTTTVEPATAESTAATDGLKPLSVEIDQSPILVTAPQSPAPAHLEVKDHESFAQKHLSDASLGKEFDKRESQAQLVSGGHRRNESTDEEDEEEEDQILTAVAPEMLQTPGDACAICLDTLEDDEDVRGLTCGHAFHASCLDPWLTGRRACCPLCKADYYVPKPRPEGEAAAEQPARSRTRTTQRVAPINAQTWAGRSFRTRGFFPGRATEDDARSRTGQRRTERRRHGPSDSFLAHENRRRMSTLQNPGAGVTTTVTAETAEVPRRGFRLGNPFAGLRSGRNNAAAAPAATDAPADSAVTPSQLEAGRR